MRAGDKVGGQARITSITMVEDCAVAPLYTVRKNHKKGTGEGGPPVRPLCEAVTAYNRKLSHMMSRILMEVWKKEDSVCLNTEEMLAEF